MSYFSDADQTQVKLPLNIPCISDVTDDDDVNDDDGVILTEVVEDLPSPSQR